MRESWLEAEQEVPMSFIATGPEPLAAHHPTSPTVALIPLSRVPSPIAG